MHGLTLKDLCISLIINEKIVYEGLLPVDLIEEIGTIEFLTQKHMAKLAIIAGRAGLYPLLNQWFWVMGYAARMGKRNLVELVLTKDRTTRARGMYEAARGNHVSLIEFLSSNEDKDPLMKYAARGNHASLMEFLSSDEDKDPLMKCAARGGHLPLVEFFINKGANDWNGGMAEAARGNHVFLVEFFIAKGATDWIRGMERAARGGHRELVEFFFSKRVEWGEEELATGMWMAAQGGHSSLVQFFLDKGADGWGIWDMGLCEAAHGGHMALVNYFISQGADDWNSAMEEAYAEGHKNLVDFFASKGIPIPRWRRKYLCLEWGVEIAT